MAIKINLQSTEDSIISYISDLEETIVIFLEKEFSESGPDWWNKKVKGKLSSYHREYIRDEKITSLKDMDFPYFVPIFCNNWEDFKKLEMFSGEALIYIKECRKVFNRWKHRRGRYVPDDQVLRDLDTLKRIGNEFNLGREIIRKLERLWILNLQIAAENYSNQKADPVEGNQGEECFEVEKEVLAVNADITKHLIDKYQIHSCPDNHGRYSYKSTKHITFFDKNGEMDAIYEIKKVIVADKSEDTDYFYPIKKELSGEEWERIMRYSSENPFHYNDRFYILSKDNIIKLDHKPRSGTGDTSGVYFTFSELRNGKKIVVPE